MNEEVLKEQQEKIEEVKMELNALANLIIQQTLDNLFHYCEMDDFNAFESLLKKVKTYKWWVIIWRFLSMIKDSKNIKNYDKYVTFATTILESKQEKFTIA